MMTSPNRKQQAADQSDIITAAQSNKPEMVRQILDQDPMALLILDENERSCLHWATEYGYSNIVHVIVGAAQSVPTLPFTALSFLKLQDSKGHTALHIACNTKREELACLYLTFLEDDAEGLNIRDYAGNTPLHRAVRLNLETVTLALCRKGAEVNCKNNLSWMPLHEAARTGNECILRALISRGAEIDALTHNHMTPFLTAFFYYKIAFKGNTYPNLEAVWKLLIEAGCSLSKSDGHWTPLSASIACDYSFIAYLLLYNGCILCRQGRWGRGLLQDAFSSSDPMLVKLLVLLGYIPTPEEVTYCSKQIPMYSKVFTRLPGLASALHKERQEVVRWLSVRTTAPPPLSEFCRSSIRTALNAGSGDKTIVVNIQALPIPNGLKRFLSLSDFFS